MKKLLMCLLLLACGVSDLPYGMPSDTERIVPETERAGKRVHYCEPLKTPVRPALHFPAALAVSQDGQTVFALNGECLGYNSIRSKTAGVDPATGCANQKLFMKGVPAAESFGFYRKYIYRVPVNAAQPEIVRQQGKPPLSCVLGRHLEIDSQDRLYAVDELNQRIYRLEDNGLKKLAEIDEPASVTWLHSPGEPYIPWFRAPVSMRISEQQLYYNAYAYSNAGSSAHRVAVIDLQTDQTVQEINFEASIPPSYLLNALHSKIYADFLPMIFFTDQMSPNNTQYFVDPLHQALSGPVEDKQAEIGQPGAILNTVSYTQNDQNIFYYSDSSRHVIYRVIATKEHELLDLSIFAGAADQSGFADGLGPSARFYAPTGLSLDATGNLFVSDTGNHAIRKITPEGAVSTFYKEQQPYVPRFSFSQ